MKTRTGDVLDSDSDDSSLGPSPFDNKRGKNKSVKREKSPPRKKAKKPLKQESKPKAEESKPKPKAEESKPNAEDSKPNAEELEGAGGSDEEESDAGGFRQPDFEGIDNPFGIDVQPAGWYNIGGTFEHKPSLRPITNREEAAAKDRTFGFCDFDQPEEEVKQLFKVRLPEDSAANVVGMQAWSEIYRAGNLRSHCNQNGDLLDPMEPSQGMANYIQYVNDTVISASGHMESLREELISIRHGLDGFDVTSVGKRVVHNGKQETEMDVMDRRKENLLYVGMGFLELACQIMTFTHYGADDPWFYKSALLKYLLEEDSTGTEAAAILEHLNNPQGVNTIMEVRALLEQEQMAGAVDVMGNLVDEIGE
ncbi:MAG: hypothetical protein SGARI_005324, partial [Bacillariaceae sp.]